MTSLKIAEQSGSGISVPDAGRLDGSEIASIHNPADATAVSKAGERLQSAQFIVSTTRSRITAGYFSFADVPGRD